MQILIIGLGNMGLNLALNLQESGHDVIGWNRSEEKRALAQEQGLQQVEAELETAIHRLNNEEHKIVWLMISAGPAIDSFLFANNGLADLLDAGDIIIDGANSHYQDTQKRAAQLAERGIELVDCGISGGIEGAREGASIMAGGDKQTYSFVEPIIRDAAAENGYGYFGESGAGHYVKMVHNGIEYGMMQALAEGVNLIDNSEFDVDLSKLTQVWNNGSIIESRLVGFLNSALVKDANLSKTDPEIGSLGTGRWTVEDALERGIPVTSIANAVFTRYQSRNKDELLFKVVQALRAEFGGHNSQERPS